jgi:histidine triad (HIT) family protein
VSATTEDTCPFCEISAGRAQAEVVLEWDNVLAIVPLNPVTPGHVLVMPRTHVEDFTTDPLVSVATMWAASRLAKDMGPVNLITSKGREATQSVFHLHLHLVPRRENDGLALPWYSGRSGRGGRAVKCPVCDRVPGLILPDGSIGPHDVELGGPRCPGSPAGEG